MKRSFQSNIRRALALALLAIAACGVTGCTRGDSRSAAEIKADVVASMLKGVKQPGLELSISADRYDTDAQELRGVHVNGKQGLLYAERATISVDEKTKAIRMKLFDVVIAQPADDSDPNPRGTEGQVIKYREMVLDELFRPARK